MRIRHLSAFVLCGLLLAGAAALAAAGRQPSGDQDERERLATVLRVTAGSRIADVGAGDGDFAIALAEVVGPTGHVYATEISSSSLSRIRRAVERQGLRNVTVVEVAEDDARLPEGCCDAIYLRNVYHHLTKPEPTVATLYRALRPGGRLAIVDFRPRGQTVSGVPGNRGGHGIMPALVVEEVTAAGFREVQQLPQWRQNNFLILFEKPASP